MKKVIGNPRKKNALFSTQIMSMFLIFFLLVGGSISAQQVININNNSALKSLKAIDSSETIKSIYGKSEKARAFDYNPQLMQLTENDKGSILQLDFFEGDQLSSVITNVTHYYNGVVGITAKVNGAAFDYCYFAVSESGITMSMDQISANKSFLTTNKDGKTYLCRYASDAVHEADRPCKGIAAPTDLMSLPKAVPSNATNSTGIHRVASRNIDKGSETLPGALSAYGSATLTSAVTIDVMVVYTAEAVAWAKANVTSIGNAIALAMQISNTAMSNSGTNITFNLVHAYQTTYDDSSIDNDTALDYMYRVSDGVMDDIITNRDKYHADLVTLFRKSDYASNGTLDSGGVGLLLADEGGFPGSAFNVCRIQQITNTTTLVHEIGHNMGCGHHKLQNDGGGIYSYSYGWRGTNNTTAGRFSTIMTYETISNTDGLNYPNIPYFSDPNKTVDGAVIGSDTTGNNTLTLNRTKRLVSLYSDVVGVCLSGLTVSSGSLSPAFDSQTTAYTVNVENSVSSITITGTTSSTGATVNGNVSGASLTVGINEFIVTATSYDGNYSKSYKIVVNRKTPSHYSYTSRPAFGSAVTAFVGDNALNLNMSAAAPVVENAFTFNLTSTVFPFIVKQSQNSNTAYFFGNVDFNNEMKKVRVSATGSYTFNVDQGSLLTIYNSSTPSTSSFVTSSGYKDTQEGYYNYSYKFSATLNANTDYYFLLFNRSATQGTVTTTSTAGTCYTETAIPNGMSYTYVAVDNADSKIKLVSAAADFRTLAAGSYTIYGVPYSYGSSPSSFVGKTLAEIKTSDAITPSSTSLSMTVNSKTVTAQAPTISTQPSSANYGQGATATALSVTATASDSGTLSYQWYSNTSNANTGGTAIDGASTSTYTPLTTTIGTFYYYVVVTNTKTYDGNTTTATTTSSVAKVVVAAIVNAVAPTIKTQPTSTKTTYSQGDTPSAITVSATSGDGGTLSYQWYSNSTNSTTGGTSINGATSSSYSPSTATIGTTYYYVIIKNTNNSVTGTKTASVTSEAIAVTVNTPVYGISISTFTGGSITASSPSSSDGKSVPSGETVTLSITTQTGYVLKSIQVLRTSNLSTIVSLSGSGNTTGSTRTFTMPNYGVTVTATFGYSDNQTIVNNAKATIENSSFVLTQSEAYDDATLKAALLAKINAVLTSASVSYTVAADELTITSKTFATTGNISKLSGTNGSFAFTVALHKDGTTNVTASNINGVITATSAYSVTKNTISNGSVAVDNTVAFSGATITLTITPNTGYKLGSLSVVDASNNAVTVSGSGTTRTFTMPSSNVTISASFAKTDDQLAIESAKSLIDAMSNVTVDQSTANTEASVKTWLIAKINSLSGMSATGITVTADNITLSNFIAAVEGASSSSTRKNGSFKFSVNLQKTETTQVTASNSGVITATTIYSVNVNVSTNGSVTASPTTGSAGTQITLSVTANDGYELDNITTTPSTTISGTGSTRTFTMPSSNVAVTASFKKTADQQAVETAQSLINAMSNVSVPQATANSETDVKNWLATQINSLISSTTGITVTASNITLGSVFNSAIEGSQASPAGTSGSFSFTVVLQKGTRTATTTSKSGVITATTYAGYFNINVGNTSNGSVTASSTAAKQNDNIQLTITPAAGYELESISTTPTLTLSGTGTTRTFSMPNSNITVMATFKKTTDQKNAETAQGLINAMTNVSVAQAIANDETTVKTWLAKQINSLSGMSTTGITVATSDITLANFTAAVAGTASQQTGTNGSFTFTVSLKKTNSAALTTDIKSGIIAATQVFVVTVNPSDNGTVSADQTTVVSGKKITLTVTPNVGYELGTLSVYNTDNVSTTVSVSRTNTTYSFNMPEYNVTVATSFKKTSNQTGIENAKTLIEGLTSLSVPQATANTTETLKTWLAQQINALSTMTISISASDITIGNDFIAAVAGTSTNPAGTNGSFSFTVQLQKTGTTTIITSSKNGTIIATSYTEPTYTITVQKSSNGSITVTPTSAKAGTPVTIKINPSSGYELASITTTPEVTIYGTGNERTFNMPFSNITITTTFTVSQEQLNKVKVGNAKTSIEGGSYRIAQATGNTEEAVKDWLLKTLNEMFGSLYNLVLRSSETMVGDVSLVSITPAVAGSAENPNGTNGSFTYNVTLTLGTVTVVTRNISGVILATPITMRSIDLSKGSDLTLTILNTGNIETGDLTVSLSGDNANLFTVSTSTIKSLAVGGSANIELVPQSGLQTGTYKVTVNVTGSNINSVKIDITYNHIVSDAQNPDVGNLTAWVQNGMLHVKGLTVGKLWRIISISGAQVYCNKADSSETSVNLPVRGVYLVVSENQVIKVLN